MENIVEIYTDGSCYGNPGPGGWAALYLWKGKLKEISGFKADTTNNQMELTAAIEALKNIKRDIKIKLHTDSLYVKQGITEWIYGWLKNDWNKGKVKNKELWIELHKLNRQFKVEWFWVKAHNGNIYNEKVDKLAKKEIENHQNV